MFSRWELARVGAFPSGRASAFGQDILGQGILGRDIPGQGILGRANAGASESWPGSKAAGGAHVLRLIKTAPYVWGPCEIFLFERS